MSLKTIGLLGLFFLTISCNTKESSKENVPAQKQKFTTTTLIILGIAQDAGFPQIGCTKTCCKNLWATHSKHYISSIGVVEPQYNTSYLFDATPDIKYQIKDLSSFLSDAIHLPDGIFLTHGHLGHYTGLMQLGREAINAQSVPVFAMPKMQKYLSTSGPWSQLVN